MCLTNDTLIIFTLCYTPGKDCTIKSPQEKRVPYTNCEIWSTILELSLTLPSAWKPQDFLTVVLCGHNVAAAKEKFLYMCWHCKAKGTFHLICSLVIACFPKVKKNYCYAVDILTLSMLWHSFHDAIKEGGDHIILHWKFLLVVWIQILIIDIMPWTHDVNS